MTKFKKYYVLHPQSYDGDLKEELKKYKVGSGKYFSGVDFSVLMISNKEDEKFLENYYLLRGWLFRFELYEKIKLYKGHFTVWADNNGRQNKILVKKIK